MKICICSAITSLCIVMGCKPKSSQVARRAVQAGPAEVNPKTLERDLNSAITDGLHPAEAVVLTPVTLPVQAGPGLISMSPGPDQTGVHRQIAIRLNFSHELQTDADFSNLIQIIDESGQTLKAEYTIEQGKSITIIPQRQLAPSAVHKIVIRSQLRTADGEPVRPFESRFLTELSRTKNNWSVAQQYICSILDQNVQCWGADADGLSLQPRTIAGLLEPFAVRVSARQSCALNIDGTVACWPNAKEQAQLIPELSNMAQLVSYGHGHCAANNAGKVFCWGENQFGQLGVGHRNSVANQPVTPIGLEKGVRLLAGGYGHLCAATALSNSLLCWGDNRTGQLATSTGTPNERPEPVRFPEESTPSIRMLAAGLGHSCLLTDSGKVFCWGDNRLGQTGLPQLNAKLSPAEIPGLANIQAISTGSSHNCAQSEKGQVKCWGWNSFAQLGTNSDRDFDLTPGELPESSAFSNIILAQYFSLAIEPDGRLKIWGTPGPHIAPQIESSSTPQSWTVP